MPRAMNKHGYPGVRKRGTPQHHRKPWYARISNGCERFIYSRNFETAEQAHEEYQRMKRGKSK